MYLCVHLLMLRSYANVRDARIRKATI